MPWLLLKLWRIHSLPNSEWHGREAAWEATPEGGGTSISGVNDDQLQAFSSLLLLFGFGLPSRYTRVAWYLGLQHRLQLQQQVTRLPARHGYTV
jgi:hypothetical protein